MNESINVQYSMTTKDLLKAILNHYYRSLAGKLFTFIGASALINAIATIYMPSGIMADGVELPFPTSSLVVSALLLIGIPCFNYFGGLFRSHTAKNGFLELNYDFSDEGVVVKGENVDSKFGWNMVDKVVESNSQILIYQNKVVFNIINKTAFTGEQLADFKSLVNSIPNLKSKLKG